MRLTKKQINTIKRLRKTTFATKLAEMFNVSRHSINYHTNEKLNKYQKDFLKTEKAKAYQRKWHKLNK